jgi:hypothetical protein
MEVSGGNRSQPLGVGASRSALRPPACLLNQLEKTIKAQRAQLLQAHGVLTCLYEVLLHADAEELDSARIWPLIEAPASSSVRVEEPRDLYVN